MITTWFLAFNSSPDLWRFKVQQTHIYRSRLAVYECIFLNFISFGAFPFVSAFATQTVNCPYNCNTCRTSALITVPNQLRYFSGGFQFLYRNVRSYSLVPFSGLPQPLQVQVQKGMIYFYFIHVGSTITHYLFSTNPICMNDSMFDYPHRF